MKKALLLTVALLLVASVASAQESSPLGYIGLFTSEEHSEWCYAGSMVTVWIMCLPGSLGQMAAEFMLSNPTNVFPGGVTLNEDLITVSQGTLDGGISIAYGTCVPYPNWHWIVSRMYMVMDGEPSMIEIVPHPDTGEISFANCEEDYPMEPCVKLTNLYVNYTIEDDECKAMGTESASWGAIKSMID